MDKHALWKWLILIAAVSGSLYFVTPIKEKIRLGLDLKGGTSFIVEIDEDRVYEDIISRPDAPSEEEAKKEAGAIMRDAKTRALEVLRNRIDRLGIAEPIIYAGKDNRIIIQLPGISDEKRQEAEDSIRDVAFLTFRMVHEDNDELIKKLFESGIAPEGYRIVSIDNGQGGADRRYKRDRTVVPDDEMEAALDALSTFKIPSVKYEFMLEKRDENDQIVYRPYFVERSYKLTGKSIKAASVDYANLNQPLVKIEFDGRGAKRFGNITADNVGRQMGIVLDDTLYSAPVITKAIHGGKAQIEGVFSLPEANRLANTLNAGSLPAPVKIVSTRSVAPSLGEDSIKSGVQAVIIGGSLVLLFMLVYYQFSGLIANLALVLNMIMLPLGMIIAAGFLSIFARDAIGGKVQLPVLTLPGIAGILLTIGMAVDANVLIFERIREEVKSGKRFWTAVTAGYDRAFVTILDANLTTLLTGVILFVFGSGPIRGFAVTLCAGIMVSMFTALVVTKLFFGTIAGKAKVGLLRMLSLVKETSIDFISKRKIAGMVSLAVIAVTWAVLVMQGVQSPDKVFGVDFTGGASLMLRFDSQVPIDQVRATLTEAGLGGAQIQYQKELTETKPSGLMIQTGSDEVNGKAPSDTVEEVLQSKHPEAGFKLVSIDQIGPHIGKELKVRALWAIGLALLGIILYISWRFELGFAAGAIVALTHDVLVTTGIFCLLGRQLSLPVVAALLTIVGYSVNDTIVVFDRIREDLRLVHGKSFKEICNLSINQTLSRTVLTSLTTLITVVMLLVFGGGAINDFALALCIGVVVGTYSSIFVATPVVLLWHKDRRPEFATAKK